MADGRGHQSRMRVGAVASERFLNQNVGNYHPLILARSLCEEQRYAGLDPTSPVVPLTDS